MIIGGRENFFHCSKCRCCSSVFLNNSHPGVEGAMHHDCPVFFEVCRITRVFWGFSSSAMILVAYVLVSNCFKEMQEHLQYACPLCFKSICDTSKVWERYDMEIAAIPTPEPYQNKMKCGFMSWVRNAPTANLTTRAKQEVNEMEWLAIDTYGCTRKKTCN
ncbi:unnamed protein product [Camellia sinensis]